MAGVDGKGADGIAANGCGAPGNMDCVRRNGSHGITGGWSGW